MIFNISQRKTISILSLAILLGCATPYKKLGKRGGYKDEKINDHVYRVSFIGNTRTSDDVVYKYFLRRCAELTLENNFSFFIIIDTEDKSKTTVVTSEGSPKNNRANVTTMSYSGDTDYSPTEYKNITKHIIEGKIALFKDGEEPINAFKAEDVLKNVRK